MWLLAMCVVLLLSMVNVSNGSFLDYCNMTVTIFSQYQTFDLNNYLDDVQYEDGEKITCDVTFVAASPDTKLSIKFPSYEIAVDGNTGNDIYISSYFPGGPRVRDDDGITVYDLLAKEYLLGNKYSRWAGEKTTKFDFSSISDSGLSSKEYVYYKEDLGEMKDMEAAKEFAKNSKVLISYKGEPSKDSFSLVVGLMKGSIPTTTIPFLPKLPDTDFNQYPDMPDDSSVQYNSGGTTVQNTVLYPIVGVVVFVVLLLSIGLRLYIRSRRIMAAQQNARVRSWLFTEFLRAAILRQATTSEDHDILVANAEGGVEDPTPMNANRTPTGAMPAPPAYETVIEEGNKFLPPSYEAAMSPVTPQGASAGPVPQSDVASQATTEPSINVTTEASVDVTGATQPLVHGPQSNANSDLQQGPIV
ncbi:unnamed protein product [Owenia fusiformis]|uniref:Uncharacterized protein n=1 Tax=Owenia fusiformis TaxID=6347 RepID=A0A8J1U1L7_OWEFU|nr:unnamed protein product [Owenia fusiformis]